MNSLFDERKRTPEESLRLFKKDVKKTYRKYGLLKCIWYILANYDPLCIIDRISDIRYTIVRIFHRRDSIKCRYLSRMQYNDFGTIMANSMFECLSRFIEEDMNKTEWDRDDIAYTVNDQITFRQVKNELMALYVWWNMVYKDRDKYNPMRKLDGLPIRHRLVPFSVDEDGDPINYTMEFLGSEEEKSTREEIYAAATEYERKIDEALIQNMIRLCQLHKVMWH